MTEMASASIAVEQLAASDFRYTITLDDTGSTPIGTFWFAWIPGEDFLATSPTNITEPAGWTANVTHENSADGFGIQWIGGAAALSSGGQAQFSFDSSDTPASIFGDSQFFPTTPTATFFIYSGAPFSDGGFEGVATQASMPCYCRGTLIRTEHGDVPVEDLAIGDNVTTAAGELRPIKWIGKRGYSGRFIMGRKDILPIRIKAGALADNVPRRDLWISPHHAMYLDDVLIEAKDLVNGVSIIQAGHVGEVEYFHIELNTHDVIFAEGAASETFVDDDSRGMFHNAHEHAELYPEDLARPPGYCAPRLDSGFVVEAARLRIARRAGIVIGGTRAGRLHGFVDEINHGCVRGWAQSIDHPEAPVCLDISADGNLIGQTLANNYRADLEEAGLGSGRHGFEFRLSPDAAFDLRSVEVARSLDGAKLALRSPDIVAAAKASQRPSASLRAV